MTNHTEHPHHKPTHKHAPQTTDPSVGVGEPMPASAAAPVAVPLPIPTPAVAPPVTTTQPAVAAYPAHQPQPVAIAPVYASAAPANQTSGMAVASMVLGIASVTIAGILTGVPALILGIIALRQKQANRGMSIAGIVMGAVSIFLTLLALGFLIFMLSLSDSPGPLSEPTNSVHSHDSYQSS